jgi:hypothetical protein
MDNPRPITRRGSDDHPDDAVPSMANPAWAVRGGPCPVLSTQCSTAAAVDDAGAKVERNLFPPKGQPMVDPDSVRDAQADADP